jgi:hypothetical protein
MELPDRVRYFGIFSFAALVTLEHFFVMKRDKVLMSLFLLCLSYCYYFHCGSISTRKSNSPSAALVFT